MFAAGKSSSHVLSLVAASVALACALAGCGKSAESTSADGEKAAATPPKTVELLNVSYDPTRELYQAVNVAFAKAWKAKTGQEVKFSQSHGGSGKQARAVIDGLNADVVTLALAGDIDQIAERTKKLPLDWQTQLPDHSAPYTSTIVFLVRKGNPKGIKDWGDLIQGDTKVITPNPKTGGGARWNYLAAWAWAQKANGGDETKAREFVKTLYQHVPIMDTGARGASITFVQRTQGDVLITWENEAILTTEEVGKGEYEIVYPSLSILTEPSVAVVEQNAKEKGTLEVAKAYLEYLYTQEGQELVARYHYRPRNAELLAKNAAKFPKLELVTVEQVAGGWKAANAKHFADGGTFDQIYAVK